MKDPDRELVPERLRLLAAWSWRLLVIAAAVYVVLYVLSVLQIIVLPLVIALFFAAILAPVMSRMRRAGLPSALGALLTLLLALGTVGLVGYVITDPVTGELDGLVRVIEQGRDDGIDLLDREFGVSREELDDAVDRGLEQISENQDVILGGVLGGVQLVALLIGGIVLVTVFTFFFLKDGPVMWAWLRDRLPDTYRPRVSHAGDAAWTTLGRWLRGQATIALFDAVMFALVLLVLGVPYVMPLVLFTFTLAFIPYVGAILSVALVSLVSLVSEGLVIGLLVLALTTAVQQADGNVVTPIVMRRAVSLHPVVVLAALAAGAIVAGIPGAILSVPTVAVLTVALPILWGRDEPAAQPVGADAPSAPPGE